MKKLKRQLTILGILCALALAALILLLTLTQGGTEQAAAEGEVIFTCSPELVTELTVRTEGEMLALRRDEGTALWTFADTGEEANAQRLALMLAELAEVRSATVIGDVTDFAPYGLEQPSMEITVSYDGTAHTLAIGDYSTAAHRYYARADLEARVFLITTSVKTAFDVTREELLLTE